MVGLNLLFVARRVSREACIQEERRKGGWDWGWGSFHALPWPSTHPQQSAVVEHVAIRLLHDPHVLPNIPRQRSEVPWLQHCAYTYGMAGKFEEGMVGWAPCADQRVSSLPHLV